MKKHLTMLALAMLFSLIFMAGCEADYADDSVNIIFQDSDLYGIYSYPVNPAKALRDFLEEDIAERNLSVEIGDIKEVVMGSQNRQEFMLYFTSDSQNICVISFNVTHSEYGPALSGAGNPSFTIAFKDTYNSQEMIDVLTSVILYLAPELDVEEAEALASAQDDTISIDGYSTPQDVGSYQIQSHYTNPYVFFSTEGLTSSFAVTVKALEQIWGGTINSNQCQELLSRADFGVLNKPSSLLEEDGVTSRVVYSDFIVTDWWDLEDWIHGDRTKWVEVESYYGETFSLELDSMRTPYEFGVGEKYRMFIYYHYGSAIICHAIQLCD